MVLAAALVPRLLYLRATASLAYYATFIFDGEWYRQRADEALAGSFLSADSVFRGPLYGWILAGFIALFGPDPHPVRVVQLLFGGINALLIWTFARRLVGGPGALLAALLYAGYGLLIYFDGEILTLTFETTLLLAFLIALTSAGALAAAAAGILLGLAAILRPSALPLALPAVVFLVRRGAGGDASRRPLRLGIFFLAGLALPIAPVVAGYRVLLGEWIPVSSQGGINFWLGNHPGADGGSALAPSTGEIDLAVADHYRDTVAEGSRRVAERALGRTLSPNEVSRYWSGRALEFAARSPGEFALLWAKRLYLAIGGPESDNNMDIGYLIDRNTPWLRWMPVTPALIVALGIPGLVARRRTPGGRLGLAMFLVLLLATSAFLVMSRYRAPLLILLLPFAGAGVWDLAVAARGRAWGTLARRGAVFLALFAFSAAGIHRVGSDAVRASQHLTLGVARERVGDDAGAAEEYRASLRFEPQQAAARFALGNALARQGERREARGEYERLLADDPRYAPFVSNSLGILLLDEGDAAGAVALFRTALEGDSSATTRANLGVALLETGRAAEAVAQLEIAWATPGAPFEVGVDLARARAAAGDSARGEGDLAALLAKEPGSLRGWMILADMRHARGDRTGEVDALRRALRALPGLAEARERLAALGESE